MQKAISNNGKSMGMINIAVKSNARNNSSVIQLLHVRRFISGVQSQQQQKFNTFFSRIMPESDWCERPQGAEAGLPSE